MNDMQGVPLINKTSLCKTEVIYLTGVLELLLAIGSGLRQTKKYILEISALKYDCKNLAW